MVFFFFVRKTVENLERYSNKIPPGEKSASCKKYGTKKIEAVSTTEKCVFRERKTPLSTTNNFFAMLGIENRDSRKYEIYNNYNNNNTTTGMDVL